MSRETVFDNVEPMTGPRIMTLARQRLCVGYVQAVVDAIEGNKLKADTQEALRSSGLYILTHPEVPPANPEVPGV